MGDSDRQLDDAAGILKMQSDALDLQYVEKWVEALELQQQWSAVKRKVR